MTAPSFVNAGTYATTTAASITPALPGSRVTGNLLLAYAHVSSTSASTWTTPSGWTLAASLGQGSFRPTLVCYRYVDGTETAPVFAVSPTAQCTAQVLQYSGAVASSPIGGVSSSTSTANPVTCPAITSTAANSLAVNLVVVGTSAAIGVSSGWTLETSTNSSSGSPTVSDLTIASAGSSSGATSVSASVANCDNFIVEIRSQAGSRPPVCTRLHNLVTTPATLKGNENG